MNVGELLQWLETIPNTTLLKGLKEPHSYRGYYEELGIEPSDKMMTPLELIDLIQGVIGKKFEGYKGGKFTMKKHTTVYLAKWGNTGEILSRDYFYPYDIALVFQYFEEMHNEKEKYHAWLRLRGVSIV